MNDPRNAPAGGPLDAELARAAAVSERSAVLARYRLLVLWAPAVLAAVVLVLAVVWIPRLPVEIAVHWNAAGQPDGFGSPWVLLLFPGILIACGALIAISILVPLHRGAPPSGFRMTGAIAPSFSVLIATVFIGSTFPQLGGAPGEEAPGILLVIIVAVALAAATGVGAWFLLPRGPEREPDAAPATPLPVADAERVVWTSTVSVPRGIVVLPVLVAVAAVAVLAFDPARWWLAVILLAVVGLLSLTLAARVTVDRRGLTVRAIGGVPLARVPLADIERVSVVHVDAPGQFGGWGVRFDGRGRRGIVLRSGPAIEVARRAGATVVVTVPDAATGAGLLAALAGAEGAGLSA